MRSNRMRTRRCLEMLALAVTSVVSALSGCATVPSGHVGVVLRAGGVDPVPLGEGAHTVSPWTRVDVYDLRVDEHNEDLAAISADGAQVEARASILTFHPVPDEIVALAREVGPRFYEVLVLPIVSATVRKVLAGVPADQLDTPGIIRVQTEVTRLAAQRLRAVSHHRRQCEPSRAEPALDVAGVRDGAGERGRGAEGPSRAPAGCARHTAG